MSGTPAVEEIEKKASKTKKDPTQDGAPEDQDQVSFEGAAEQSQKDSQEKGEHGELPPRGHNQSGPPPEDPQRPDFVRWSPSTELGDFIRDAARAKEFAVDIEGAPESILVGVPSFADRTFYLRMRLRKTSKRILELADVKRECDQLAQKGAQRVVS